MGTRKPAIRPPSAGKAKKPKAKPAPSEPGVPPGFTMHRPDASTAVLVPIEKPDFPNPPKEQGKF